MKFCYVVSRKEGDDVEPIAVFRRLKPALKYHANRMAEIKPFCRRDTRANHLRKSKTTYGIVLPTFQGRIVNHNRPKRC